MNKKWYWWIGSALAAIVWMFYWFWNNRRWREDAERIVQVGYTPVDPTEVVDKSTEEFQRKVETITELIESANKEAIVTTFNKIFGGAK